MLFKSGLFQFSKTFQGVFTLSYISNVFIFPWQDSIQLYVKSCLFTFLNCGHLGCFHFSVIMFNAAINKLYKHLCSALIYFENIPKASIIWFFLENNTLTYISTKNAEGFCCLPSSPHHKFYSGVLAFREISGGQHTWRKMVKSRPEETTFVITVSPDR